uniref:Putative secreted protein n=1 Tax=Ixodes ricinus TaxID=34613 RepID=A0A6B0UY11_IXORI
MILMATSLPVGTCLASFTLAKLPLPMVLSSRYRPMWGSSEVRLREDAVVRGASIDASSPWSVVTDSWTVWRGVRTLDMATVRGRNLTVPPFWTWGPGGSSGQSRRREVRAGNTRRLKGTHRRPRRVPRRSHPPSRSAVCRVARCGARAPGRFTCAQVHTHCRL